MTEKNVDLSLYSPMAGPYFVFDVVQHYPVGGIGDCEGIYKTVEEAIAKAEERPSREYRYVCNVQCDTNGILEWNIIAVSPDD